MDNFFSFLYKFILVIFVFIMVYKISLYVVMSKLTNRIHTTSDEEKSKIIHSLSRVLTIYKILFWMAPLNLIFAPIAIYFYYSTAFIEFTISVALMYIAVLEDYFYRKTILRRIGS